MSSRRHAEQAVAELPLVARPGRQSRPWFHWRRRALVLLWPAFLMAGVLEVLVFTVVNPAALHGMGLQPLRWSASAVYSVTFLVFWGVIAASGAITLMLQAPGPASSAARGA